MTKNYGFRTAISCGALAAFGTYHLITGGPVETYDDPSAVVRRLLGGMGLLLSFTVFSIRIAIAKVLDKLQEIDERA